MMKFIVATALLAMLAPAMAQTPATPPSSSGQASKPAKEKPPRMICESQMETGSRVATNRVCMTADQWKDHQSLTQTTLDQFHMDTQSKGGSPH